MAQPSGGDRARRSGIRLRAWNLLLLPPFLILVTPWVNRVEPRLYGVPFFYWSQFVWVLVSVGCVVVVHLTTRGKPARTDRGDAR